jgi:hypothetical protein
VPFERERHEVGESQIPSSEERSHGESKKRGLTVHELAGAVNGQIVTEDGDYDHCRLTTIYTDHDLPEHDASGSLRHFTVHPWSANARAKHRKHH